MRWSIIRLIWLRELRDQLRDRRTLFMIAGLPLLLYPILGFAVIRFAIGFVDQPSVIGITHGPERSADFPSTAVPVLAAQLVVTPVALPGAGVPIDYVARSTALIEHPALHFPRLVERGRFGSFAAPGALTGMLARADARLQIKFFDWDQGQEALERRQIDLLLSAGPNFWESLNGDLLSRAYVRVHARKHDDRARLAVTRLYEVLLRWKRDLNAVHLARQGLPRDFDEPFFVLDPLTAEAMTSGGGDGGANLLLRLFPFMLVMWSLAGALYPAVDVCAGEKERGTMETLLISPASREEIVYGKFLTIWLFSSVTAVLNLASMALTTRQFADELPQAVVSPLPLLWSASLLLPLSAFFSAICLAVGAYARSSKEGQYYLMPLFLVTMPLIFLTLAPGVELNPFYSMIPVTGVTLLMQSALTAHGKPGATWYYFFAVIAPIALYSWLALRWAVEQFHREEVLFREAERLDLLLWLRRLFREKTETPTAGQAIWCFLVLLGLRWASTGLGQQVPLLSRSGIVFLAFVAAPPLFMALLLTTRPRLGLSLRRPSLAYVLVALLLLPVAELTHHALSQFPRLLDLLQERRLFVEDAFRASERGTPLLWTLYVLCLAFLSAVSKEIAFRGLILNGLRRRFATWPAILISSFLFAVYFMNVFVLVPAFLLGVALGVLAVRSGSLLPGILVHLGAYALLFSGGRLEPLTEALGRLPDDRLILWRIAISAVCTTLAVALMILEVRQKRAVRPDSVL
jgi:sodium transport system permease protein